jgi:hypothetical protein
MLEGKKKFANKGRKPACIEIDSTIFGCREEFLHNGPSYEIKAQFISQFLTL